LSYRRFRRFHLAIKIWKIFNPQIIDFPLEGDKAFLFSSKRKGSPPSLNSINDIKVPHNQLLKN